MKYALPIILIVIFAIWYISSLFTRIECSGYTMDGSTFKYKGVIFTTPSMTIYYDKVVDRIVENGEWHISDFANDFGINPKNDKERISFYIKEKPFIWFPVKLRISGPELEFPPSIANQYNNPGLRIRIQALPKSEVLKLYNKCLLLE